jgi:hypothetical protein
MGRLVSEMVVVSDEGANNEEDDGAEGERVYIPRRRDACR